MNTTDIADRFRRIVEEGIGAGDETVLEAFVAEDVVEHQRGNSPGLDGVKAVGNVLHRWMSDFSLTVEDVVVAGDVVWTRNRARGINTSGPEPAAGRACGRARHRIQP